MAVKGKRKYTIYLNEESANLVRKYVELHESSLSDFLNNAVVQYARLLKREGFQDLLGRIGTMSMGEYRWFMEEFLNPPRNLPEEDDLPPVSDEEREGK